MRTIMLVRFPVEPFNSLARNGLAGLKIHQILDDMKPEAAYFTELDGHRGGIFVVNVADPSDLAVLGEPWFLTFDAEVQFKIAMTIDDLVHASLEGLGKKWA
jgi:hypothetical protein